MFLSHIFLQNKKGSKETTRLLSYFERKEIYIKKPWAIEKRGDPRRRASRLHSDRMREVSESFLAWERSRRNIILAWKRVSSAGPDASVYYRLT
jgi:hypothetical protein